MPRIPIDYNNGLIYKIVCNDIKIKEVYYGSTTSFVKRKNAHKTVCNNINSNCYNQPKYQFIRENGGWDNWNMVLVKYYSCNNKLELEREERKCMEQDENRLNANLPAKTDDEKKEYHKQRYIDNIDKIREYKKQYRIDNAEKLKEQQKQYNIDNADKIKEKKKQYNIDNADKIKEKKKQYNIDNADKIKEKKKQYRIDNAEMLKEKQKQYYLKNKK